MKTYIDHIVISVKNFKKSVKFYETFLGKPRVSEWDASWQLGDVTLFLTFPYQNKPKAFNKHDIGLNHIAFGAKTVTELRKFEKLLDRSKIKHSGIQIDRYSNKEFIWFDDPDGIRLEFYFRS